MTGWGRFFLGLLVGLLGGAFALDRLFQLLDPVTETGGSDVSFVWTADSPAT